MKYPTQRARARYPTWTVFASAPPVYCATILDFVASPPVQADQLLDGSLPLLPDWIADTGFPLAVEASPDPELPVTEGFDGCVASGLAGDPTPAVPVTGHPDHVASLLNPFAFELPLPEPTPFALPLPDPPLL